jgi:hypothetical protein
VVKVHSVAYESEWGLEEKRRELRPAPAVRRTAAETAKTLVVVDSAMVVRPLPDGDVSKKNLG